MTRNGITIAYFTMEIGLEPGIPTYSGGLGMLAGDTLRSCADLRLPVAGMSLLHRKGYFRQSIDRDGLQHEAPRDWRVDEHLEPLEPEVEVAVEGRTVRLRAWRYAIAGVTGGEVPVYFLDADLPANDPRDRALTGSLYGGDDRYRISQEIILGIGGVRMLRALGHREVSRFHMNEGHSALLTLELLRETVAGDDALSHESVLAHVREQCVFTTHTPVPAGHDRFPMSLVREVLAPDAVRTVDAVFPDGIEELNMTLLALGLSHYVNGVAKKHGEVSRHMFASYVIDSITNGVHAGTWTSRSFQDLYDRHIPGWREDNFSLRSALGIPPDEVWKAHCCAKDALISHVNNTTGAGFRLEDFTIGFARRATPYKRAGLVLDDIDRLQRIAATHGPIQIVFAGKAHPRDGRGKELIQRIIHTAGQVLVNVKIVYLPDYDMSLGGLLTSGVDLWLNTPQPPLEASGTSGMKAALNGVPSFSVLDGWWIEGCIEGVTGWSIGGPDDNRVQEADRRGEDAESLYDKLEHVILPTYYREMDRYIRIMRHAMAQNGSFFNTQRMVLQYISRAYFL